MAIYSGWTYGYFSSSKPQDTHTWPSITHCLRFMSHTVPSVVNLFLEIRTMVMTRNTNMAAVFATAWVICFDKSVSIWHNIWTCPGWVFCPRKPHPFGNEYHSACCALLGIMFVVDLVCDKDHPKELSKPQ